MYRVMIVDDFPYDRKNIVDMVNSFDDLPLCVVGACENGYEALEAVHNLQPDILICDVEMPGMSGIDLANLLREEKNRAHVVFCSLYEKVHYLQAAIQLRCDGYLMKPISREELGSCLREVLLQLLDVKAQQEAFEAMQAAMADNRKSLIRDFFSDVLLAHDYSTEYLQHRRRQLGLDGNVGFRLAVLEVSDANAVSDRLTMGDSSVLSFRTYQCLKRENGWEMPHYVIRLSERRYAVVFCFDSEAMTVEETRRATDRALNDFVAKMQNMGIGITATFSRQISQTAELNRQYELCRYRLNHCWQYGGDSVIFSEDADVPLPEPAADMQIVYNELRMLLNLENEDIRRASMEYVAKLLGRQSLFQQQMICYYLLGNVRYAMQGNDLPVEMDRDELESLFQRVMALNSSAECMAFADDLIVRAYNCIHQQRNSGDSDLIERVKRFIRESDLRSIHLKLIAEAFSYSPNYLNHVFKTATGMTILDYITVCRIARAKELMQTTGMKPSEIATEIGYSHATYLSIVFKKYEGITPKQFMERSRL